MFTTASDVQATTESEKSIVVPEIQSGESSGFEFTAPHLIEACRKAITTALGDRDSKKLIKRSRALYWDSEHRYRVACTVSKRYQSRSTPYWYAYHPSWDEFLAEAEDGWFALGCIDMDFAFALPLSFVRSHLSELNITSNEGKSYWHIKLLETNDGEFSLHLPKSGASVSLRDYVLTLPEADK
jgi:hypothetical protein